MYISNRNNINDNTLFIVIFILSNECYDKLYFKYKLLITIFYCINLFVYINLYII